MSAQRCSRLQETLVSATPRGGRRGNAGASCGSRCRARRSPGPGHGQGYRICQFARSDPPLEGEVAPRKWRRRGHNRHLDPHPSPRHRTRACPSSTLTGRSRINPTSVARIHSPRATRIFPSCTPNNAQIGDTRFARGGIGAQLSYAIALGHVALDHLEVLGVIRDVVLFSDTIAVHVVGRQHRPRRRHQDAGERDDVGI